MSKQMVWEYLTIVDGGELRDNLYYAGQEGWELVSVYYGPHFEDDKFVKKANIFVLKREKVNGL